MPSASLLGRLTIGAGTLGMVFVATAGTAPAGTAHAGTAPAGQAHAGRRAGNAPRVSSVVPAEGARGWRVVLAGRRFTRVTSVTFGGASAAYRVTSSTRITATVPAGAKSGRVTVSAKAGQGRSPAFTVTSARTLEPAETLPSADALHSKDGHFTLAMRASGNLVYFVTGTGHTLWASGTAGHPGAYLTMLSNGNLVVYAASGATTLWSSKTSGHGPARLVAQANGNLIVYEGSTTTWAAGSYDATLEPGESLRPGWSLNSGKGYKLTMRKNGNLVETGPAGTAWSSKTSGHAGAAATMRASGNLVVHLGTRLWATKTSGHSGARLAFRPGGVLAVLYRGKALWASKKAPAPPLTLGQWVGRAGPGAADTYYGYPYPHSPACTDGGACHADAWAFYQGQCTSWVAYRLNQLDGIAFTNSYGGKGRWGNAVHWGRQARALKISVTATPAVGSVAWYGATKAAPDGHVAYVEKVNSPTSIVMSEMNYDSDNGFWVHTVTKATGDWPADFIHLADR